MEAPEFDEEDLFRAIGASGARVLLIGRRALVALGLPVLTADYDLWSPSDEVERLNAALAPLGLFPSRSVDEARARGRYVLEGDEHVDVLVAKQASTKDGVVLTFDAAWSRRRRVPYAPGVAVDVPSIDDLILTKRWSLRPKDVSDIELLEQLRASEREGTS